MKETEYGMARSTPHSNLNRLEESLSHKRPLMHDNMICCQFSPVAHLHIRQSTDYRTQAIPTCSKLKETVIIYTLFWFYIHSKRCHFVIPG